MSIVRKTLEQIRREGGGRVDRARLDVITDAEIQTMIDADDAGELTADQAHGARLVKPAKAGRDE
jgi:hypothetical protein